VLAQGISKHGKEAHREALPRIELSDVSHANPDMHHSFVAVYERWWQWVVRLTAISRAKV
jgi:hypothetical protein